MSVKRKRLPVGVFFTTLILTLCVLGLGLSCLLIEYNLQRTTYGRVDFGVAYTLEGGELTVTATDTGEPIAALSDSVRQAVGVLIAAPARLTGRLLQLEFQGLEALLNRLLAE